MTTADEDLDAALTHVDDPRKFIGILNLNAAIAAARLVVAEGLLDSEFRTKWNGEPMLYQVSSENWRTVYTALGLPVPDVPEMPTVSPAVARRRARTAMAVDAAVLTPAERDALGGGYRVDDGERECLECHNVLPLKKFPTRKDRTRGPVCRDCIKATH